MGNPSSHSAPPDTTFASPPEDRVLKILVADGDASAGNELAAVIRDLGHLPIGPAASGAEAVRFCEAMTPDLAFVDVHLSVDDELYVVEAIAKRRGVPVVIVTDSTHPSCIDDGARFGALAYLIKPVSADQIRASLRVAWARARDFVERDHAIAQLRQRLDDRKIIEQAKWLLVQRKSISEPEAMRMLQRQARNLRRSLVDVARALIENDDLLSES